MSIKIRMKSIGTYLGFVINYDCNRDEYSAFGNVEHGDMKSDTVRFHFKNPKSIFRAINLVRGRKGGIYA